MAYRDYLRLEGTCSIALGLALAALAFPELLVDVRAPLAWAALAPAVLVVLAVVAAVLHGVPPLAPGRWLTERPLGHATHGAPGLDAGRLRRRLLVETGAWIVAVGLWVVLARRDGGLILGTGLASAAFGAVQALAAPRRVAAVERERAERYVVARRPGLGTPDLAVTSQPEARGQTP